MVRTLPVGLLLGTLLCFVTATHATAANYYVDSSSGQDGNSGTSTSLPWKNLSRVNSQSLNPGDVVSFKRGGSWTGTLSVTRSGASGNPITFTAYGTGQAPTLTNPCSGCYSDIIQVFGTNIVIRDLFLRDAHQAAIHLKPGSGEIVISDNEITRVGYGVLVQTSNNLITRNKVHDLTMVVNTTSPDDDYGANGFWLQTADNNEISYNSCINCRAPSYDYGTDGGFVEFWTGNNNNTIHHNWVENTNGFIEIGGNASGQTVSDNTISYNVSVNNLGFGCLHTDGSFRTPIENLRIENNTIVNTNVEGYRLLDCMTPSPSMLVFRNNIVVSPIQIASSGDFTRANNLYYLTNGAPVGFSLGSGEKIGNPQFRNLGAFDFHLQSGSPARDAGQNLGYSLDYDNAAVPTGSAPDMGAFESTGVVLVTPTPIATPLPTACQKADINQDNFVDLSDYSLLVANFFKSPLQNSRSDINGDGTVDLSDYSLLVRSFFMNCP